MSTNLKVIGAALAGVAIDAAGIDSIRAQTKPPGKLIALLLSIAIQISAAAAEPNILVRAVCTGREGIDVMSFVNTAATQEDAALMQRRCEHNGGQLGEIKNCPTHRYYAMIGAENQGGYVGNKPSVGFYCGAKSISEAVMGLEKEMLKLPGRTKVEIEKAMTDGIFLGFDPDGGQCQVGALPNGTLIANRTTACFRGSQVCQGSECIAWINGKLGK